LKITSLITAEDIICLSALLPINELIENIALIVFRVCRLVTVQKCCVSDSVCILYAYWRLVACMFSFFVTREFWIMSSVLSSWNLRLFVLYMLNGLH